MPRANRHFLSGVQIHNGLLRGYRNYSREVFVKVSAFALVPVFLILSGCSTTQEILLAKSSPTKPIQTIARSPGDTDAADMNKNVKDALTAQGIEVKSALPADTPKPPASNPLFPY